MASSQGESAGALSGRRVALLGKLAGMSKRDAAQIIRRQGGVVVERPDATTHWAVLGEQSLPFGLDDAIEDWLDPPARQAAEQGSLEIITETELWRRLGLVDDPHPIQRLYTPAMLAELLGVPVAVIRRWHRRGLIVPARQVCRLPYFDYQEVAGARRLAELLSAGVSPAAIERKLADLARFLPRVARPLAQLSLIVQDRDILLRRGDGLAEPSGQLRFDFQSVEAERAAEAADEAGRGAVGTGPGLFRGGAESIHLPTSPQQLFRLAAELEEDGQLAAAAEMYRAAMAATGPTAEGCFELAELLYRLGDVSAARERYFVAIELDEDYVEARANLGCLLAETGQHELALAAFDGALRFHPDYADVHYHLARLLDELHRYEQAEEHWEAFLRLAPDSPWAEQARMRLNRA